ncbi:MAG: acetolactate synthase large subunit, partial [Rhodospirillaceae bacterium]|nr:acetolactate synthase large subunit [Rhodospirillaceae bacterium]
DALADQLGARTQGTTQALSLPDMPVGAITAENASAVIARAIPEDAVVVDEGITVGFPAYALSAGAAPHDWLFITGGGIGWAMPVAVGAAVAAPDKKILCIQGDGGAMYTIQALWTMARERLDVTTVVFSNRGYLILDIELQRHGLGPAGANAHRLMDMDEPRIDFVKMADAQGVDAHRVEDCSRFAAVLGDCLKQPGPHFIEVMMA